jgi:hypothetical protein
MFSSSTTSPRLLLILALSLSAIIVDVVVDAGNPEEEEKLELGSRDRFWKHHVDQQSLVYDGVDQYQNIKSCIQSGMTADELQQIVTEKSTTRKAGKKVTNPFTEEDILVVVENAMHPVHVKAVQTLASCVRTYIPSLYESRAMYQEMDLDTDPGLGGNCPTHLAVSCNDCCGGFVVLSLFIASYFHCLTYYSFPIFLTAIGLSIPSRGYF